MTNNEKEEKKRVGEKTKKYYRKYTGGFKSIVFLWFISALIASIMSLHDFSQNWAWEIAKTIITIDGIILGFTFIGITLLSAEQSHLTLHIGEVFTEHLKDYLEELKLRDLLSSDTLQKKLVSSMESALIESFMMPFSIPLCIIFLITSLAFALSLFGVSDIMANEGILRQFFGILLVFSIGFLLMSVNLVYRFIDEVVSKSWKARVFGAVKESLETFTEELEDTLGKVKKEKTD